MSTTTESILGRSHACGKPGCAQRILRVTLTGLAKDGGGTVVSVDEAPVSKAHDFESSLVAVQRTISGHTGGKVTPHVARGMLATGMVHRLHVCIGARRQ